MANYNDEAGVPRGVAEDMMKRAPGGYGFILDTETREMQAVKRVENGLTVVASRQYAFVPGAPVKAVLERMLSVVGPLVKEMEIDAAPVYVKGAVMQQFHKKINHLPRWAQIITY